MKITLINGNKQPYTLGLPKIRIVTRNLDGKPYSNQIALNHMKENTGLKFKDIFGALEAQPKSAKQIIALLMTYNFTTTFYNNATWENTLMLRFKCSCSNPCCFANE